LLASCISPNRLIRKSFNIFFYLHKHRCQNNILTTMENYVESFSFLYQWKSSWRKSFSTSRFEVRWKTGIKNNSVRFVFSLLVTVVMLQSFVTVHLNIAALRFQHLFPPWHLMEPSRIRLSVGVRKHIACPRSAVDAGDRRANDDRCVTHNARQILQLHL